MNYTIQAPHLSIVKEDIDNSKNLKKILDERAVL